MSDELSRRAVRYEFKQVCLQAISWMQWQFWMTGCRLAGCYTLLGPATTNASCWTWLVSLAAGGQEVVTGEGGASGMWPCTPADTTWMDAHVSDVGWCDAVCGLVLQQTQLECYSLSDVQPMQDVSRIVKRLRLVIPLSVLQPEENNTGNSFYLFSSKHYKNLAIANRSCISCAHNTLRAFIGLNITPWLWNLKLRITQGHWKRNHWRDHTWLTISWVIWC